MKRFCFHIAIVLMLLGLPLSLFAEDASIETITVNAYKKDSEGKTLTETYSYQMSVNNMHLNITTAEQGITAYTKAFKSDDGIWYCWEKEPNNTPYNWIAVDNKEEADKIAKLEALFSYVKNENSDSSSDDLEQVGYYHTTTSSKGSNTTINDESFECIAKKEGETFINNYNAGYVYDGKVGRYLFAYQTDKDVRILTFKNLGSLTYLKEKAGLTIDYNNNDIVDDLMKWLKGNHKTETDVEKFYQKVSQYIYYSLVNHNISEIYNTDLSYGQYFLKGYIKYMYAQNLNPYASLLNKKGEYNPNDYEAKNGDFRTHIVTSAKAYLSKAVEYGSENKSLIENNKIYKKGNKEAVLSSENNITNGNPMPYLENGYDTPSTFWDKMEIAVKVNKKYVKWIVDSTTFPTRHPLFNKSTEYPEVKYYSTSYRPGIEAGCDSWGMLAGILYENDGLYDKSLKDEYEALILRLKTQKKDKEENEDNYKTELKNPLISSIDKYTLIINSLNDVEKGDIVTYKNSKGENGVAIVSDVDASNVKVIYMDKEAGFACEKLFSEIKEEEGFTYVFRRLLGKKDEKDKPSEDFETPVYDVLDNVVDSSKTVISIGKIYEQTQVSSYEKYPFIPNTGEYLVLDDISAHVYNKIGIRLNGSEIRLKLKGVEDYNYPEVSPTVAPNNNLEVNFADNFEIALLDADYTVLKDTEGKELKNDLSRTGFSIKNYSFLREDNDKKIKTNIENESFKINDYKGKLFRQNNTSLRIGIRPKSAGVAYPGDNLKLLFEVESLSSSNTADSSAAVVENNANAIAADDVLTVYDKKMLWRANLYLDKNESRNADLDWNNTHPWNVPADDTDTDTPYWWSAADWGYNEWNRTYSLNEDSGELEYGEGDGTQVINFRDFAYTPVRKVTTKKTYTGNVKEYDSNTEGDLNNNIMNAVSYDYPPTDLKKSTNGIINYKTIRVKTYAHDSPFDFLWKLNQQRKLLDQITTFNAPNDWWVNYKEKDEDGFKSYIPGLGLFFHDPGNSTWNELVAENLLNDKKEKTNIFKFDYDFEARRGAGTDCVGFVQRTSSYRVTDGDKRIYNWAKIEADSAETKDINNIDTNRAMEHFPVESSLSNKIVSYDDIAEENRIISYYDNNVGDIGSPTELEFENLKLKFLKIIPGDIIFYGSYDDDGIYGGEHIGEIDYVDYEAIKTAKSIKEIMGGINVIECVYLGKVNYVIKRSMIQGQGNDGFVHDDKVRSWYKYKETVLREWQIRRITKK